MSSPIRTTARQGWDQVSTDSAGYVYIVRTAYDGDGRRVRRVDNFGAIHYAGPHYERKAS